MPAREYWVNFYQVRNAGKANLTFDQAVQQIWGLNKGRRLHSLSDGETYGLYSVDIDGPFVCGEMGRLSIDQIDPKGDRDGNVEPMPIEDDEGQVHLNYFAYHIPTRCVAVPFQQSGVRANRIQQFLNGHYGPASMFLLEQLFDAEVYRELLSRMKKQRKAVLKIRMPKNGSLLRDAGLDDSEIISIARTYQAATVKVELSLDRRPGSLKAVERLIRPFLKMPDALQAARIEGRGANDEKLDPVDFLGLALRTRATFRISRKTRRTVPRQAYAVLKGAIQEKLHEITSVADNNCAAAD
ncbi:MAG: hypothetical protein ACOC95_01170 [Planctomycetota bacterium]